MSLHVIPCGDCKHLFSYDKSKKFACPAFPDGIPSCFFEFESFHNRVVDGQVGNFVFEPWPGKEDRMREKYKGFYPG